MDEDLHGSEGRCCNAVLCLCAFLLKQQMLGCLFGLPCLSSLPSMMI